MSMLPGKGEVDVAGLCGMGSLSQETVAQPGHLTPVGNEGYFSEDCSGWDRGAPGWKRAL